MGIIKTSTCIFKIRELFLDSNFHSVECGMTVHLFRVYTLLYGYEKCNESKTRP